MNVALISSWHVHARGYAKEFMEIPNCKVVAVWDEDKQTGLSWAEELNCDFYEDYDELLKNPDIDGVAICSPTVSHPELIIKAANAKKHIFTEKVLAITPQDCKKIRQAVLQNNVKFAIAFIHRCRADLILAKEIAEKGLLGELTYARVRNTHNGGIANWLPDYFYDKEQCGGGAMIDLGAHTIYLLRWILGDPKSVTATFTKVTGREVEDNAVTVMEFETGAIGVAETSFVATNSPFTMEINGTKGSLLVRNGVSYANEATEGKWVNAEINTKPLPSTLVQWVEGVTQDKEIIVGLDEAISLTTIMDAAYQSCKTGKKVMI